MPELLTGYAVPFRCLKMKDMLLCTRTILKKACPYLVRFCGHLPKDTHTTDYHRNTQSHEVSPRTFPDANMVSSSAFVSPSD